MEEPIVDPERAARLARAILSDVVLYNPERVKLGLERDDLFERLGPEIEEAQTYFESRVDSEIARKTGAWGRALVDVLVYRNAHIRSRIW